MRRDALDDRGARGSRRSADPERAIACVPREAAAGEGSLYKFVTYLDLLDGNDQVTEKWTVEGCWLENVDYTDLDYSSSEPVTITLSVSYDHARQNIGGYAQGPGIATGGAGRI